MAKSIKPKSIIGDDLIELWSGDSMTLNVKANSHCVVYITYHKLKDFTYGFDR